MGNELLLARVRDTAERCRKNSVPLYLGFLSEDEAQMASNFLKNSGVRFSFYGGFEEAERTYLACLPDWCEAPDYPITALTFSFNKAYSLTHRDFLGSVTALGISRGAIGDIAVEQGRAVMFLSREIGSFVREQLTKVGKVGVQITEGFMSPLPGLGTRKEFSDTVASLRLDCVISCLCNLSRNKAEEIITDGLVAVNSCTQQKSTVKVCSGEKISVRGKGKFEIINTDNLSKKGRIILRYTKYI